MIYDLVLEGGGTKSLAFLGALQELEARGHTVGRLLGTSAGSIAGAMLACGYTSHEAADIMYDAAAQQPTFSKLLTESAAMEASDLRKGKLRELLRTHNAKSIPDFMEEQIDTLLFDALLRSSLMHPLLSFVEQGHWYSDEHFLRWLEQMLDSGSFQGKPRQFSHMTLREFHQATEAELSLVVSDMTASHVLILNHRTAPHCPLVWAMRMSAGLPLVWKDVLWQDAWGTYLDRDITGHHVAEGEIFSPFPIELFFSDLPQVISLVGPKQSDQVLGFVIDDTTPVPGAAPPEPDPLWTAMEALPPANSLLHIITSVLQTRKKLTIEAVHRHIVHLPTKGYRQLDFKLTDDRFQALVKAGREATSHYFSRTEIDVTVRDDENLLISSPDVIAYINDSAKQQLAYIGAIHNYYTDGGLLIQGDVNVRNGDFIGRDQTGKLTD